MKGFTVDEDMQMAAMEQMMAGNMGADPFASEAPPGYSMVMVPDAVLPAVMELVSQAESGGSALGAAAPSAGGAEVGGMPLM